MLFFTWDLLGGTYAESRKIYFYYDNGIRNAVLANFSILESRTNEEMEMCNLLPSYLLSYLRYR